MVQKLVSVARKKDGQVLDLVPGRAAVLTTPAGRMQAGSAVPSEAELRAWVQACLPEQVWVTFELGEPAAFVAEISGQPHRVSARQAGGVVQLRVQIAPAPAPADATPPKPDQRRPVSPSKPEEKPAVVVPTGTRARPSTPVPDDRPLDRMLRRLVELGGSDLHLTASCLPMIRLHGDMTVLPDAAMELSSEHILLMCEEIAPAANRREFREENDTDFAYEIAGVARFRANLFRDRRGVGAVFRQIPSTILSLDQLGLPECVRTLCSLRKGLVLVTGPTGSGKSTTLAAMIDEINASREEHVITIEDPIEFVHENKRCLVNQREVHSHTESFKRALRAALREDPDIVLVGELRDLETMAIAIETAETGHLVFGTLHTTTAVSTVDRLIDQFPPDRQEQVRVMLSESLKGVIAQILLKRREGGRVAAHEILLGVPAVANLIREGKTFQTPSIMQTNKRIGMQLLNDALADLVRRDVVEADEAVAKAADKDALRAMLKLPPAAAESPPTKR